MSDSEKLIIAKEALQWSYDMFLARDLMNAQVHCTPLRLSPITKRVKNAIEIVGNFKLLIEDLDTP